MHASDPLAHLSKISSLREFEQHYSPTHPVSRHGPMRHGALQRRLASCLPYVPPLKKMLASHNAAANVEVPPPSPELQQRLVTPEAEPPARDYRPEQHADYQSSVSSLLTRWLRESQQLTVYFATEMTTVHREIEELQGLARTIIERTAVNNAEPKEDVEGKDADDTHENGQDSDDERDEDDEDVAALHESARHASRSRFDAALASDTQGSDSESSSA